MLENIRSAENVGAIFRTADASGVAKIFLVGITPTPIDRFGRARRDIAKSALGAQMSVEWEARKSAPVLLRELKKKGFYIVALEQAEAAIDYKKLKVKGEIALIVGNEVEGVSATSQKLADTIIKIPMKGKKESLNVSVATGIALYRLFGF